MTFRETIQILTKIFGEQSSLFNTRWQCLKLTKKDCEDYTTFANTVNRYCERFRLNEITPDMFKYFIFIQGLTLPSEKEVRTEGLGFCSKFKAKFEVKVNVMPVYRPKRPIPYASIEIIDKDLKNWEL